MERPFFGPVLLSIICHFSIGGGAVLCQYIMDLPHHRIPCSSFMAAKDIWRLGTQGTGDSIQAGRRASGRMAQERKTGGIGAC
jgi:hypothetical protein